MADVRDPARAKTCIDTENARVDVVDEVLDANLSVAPASSLVGTFANSFALPCRPSRSATGGDLHDDEVCVPGGLFVFGSEDGATGTVLDDAPVRIAAVPSFL